MDDDVQYLGTRLAAPEPLPNPCEASVTGITLHVDKCGDNPPHTLTFHRANADHIYIGRKSGSDVKPMRRDNDNHNAVFACQVVSAKHAKLVFADSGQIYIVDRRSRHGTHLMRCEETTQRMLQPEVETPLANGDVLTFGKVVGAGSYHVSPVTVRVELLTSQPTSEPPAARALTIFDPPSPALSRPRKLSSGRYGLISASCIESDSSPSDSSVSVSSDVALSPSDQESDMEDEHVCIPPVFRDGQSKMAVKIPTFRSFIRDVYHHPVSHSPVILDDDEPLEDTPSTPLPSGAARPPSPVVVVIDPFPQSRSPSPVEVPTPPLSETRQSEPAVIGAWPDSRPESPRHSSLEAETGRSEMPPAAEIDHEPELAPTPAPIQPNTCQGRGTPLSNDALIELMHRLPPPPPFFPMGGPFSTSIASDFGLPSVPPPPPPPFAPHRVPPFQPVHKIVTEYVNSEVKGPLKNVEERISAMQGTIDNLKIRQTVTEEDVADVLVRVEILEPDSERLHCRISGVERNNTSISTLQGQMTTLQNHVTALREKMDVPEPRPVEPSLDDIRVCANALNNLVLEMKSLREDVEKRIEAEMVAIQSARMEALDAMREVTIAAESVRSSKRKREDEEPEEEAHEVVVPAVEPVACSPPPIMDEVPVSEVSIPQVPIPQVPVFLPVLKVDVPDPTITRPNKRPRTAMYTVARTAAAMAVGAAATWSALAFS